MKLKLSYVLLFLILISLSYSLLFAQVAGPALLTPADDALNIATNGTFTWDSVTSATSYIINISTDSTFSTINVTKSVDTTEYRASGLLNNQIYFWRVQAKIGAVASDFSSVRSFKTKLGTPLLSNPINLAVNIPTTTTLSWGAIIGANNYTLDVSKTIDFNVDSIIFTQNNLTTLNRVISGLLYQKTYYWRVRATQASGNMSDYSVIRSFTTIKAGPTLLTPADNALNYNYAKVTYTWNALAGATSYELQVSDTDSFKTGTKTYTNILGASYTPSADYLSYNKKYYWRVRGKFSAVYTDYSGTFDFTVGAPRDSINDVNARVLFNHSEGRVSEITYKQGSNRQLLNEFQNNKNKTGLGRITNEITTKLASWTENAGNYTYNYDNTIYGSKSLNIKWNADSVVVNVVINLSANKSAALNASFQPGGDTGPLYDSILYATPSNVLTASRLNYFGTTTTLFSGYTNLIAMFDGRFSSEYFGYVIPDSIQTFIYDNPTFGPILTFPASASPRTVTLAFNITDKQDYFPWANKKYILITYPSAGIKLKNIAAETISWKTYGVAGNADIDLSINGGSTFPYPLSAGNPNDGTENIILPNLSAQVPLHNCKIRITGLGVIGYSQVFSIVESAVSVFRIPSDLHASPGWLIDIPIIVQPVSTDSIYAFDIRLEYNKDVLIFGASDFDQDFVSKDWTTEVTNNSAGGYVQIGGFRNSSGLAISSTDTLLRQNFTIKTTARVGTEIPIKINNTYLSAADDSAKTMKVMGIDGLVTVYGGVSGNLLYIVSKEKITGDSLVQLINVNTSGSDVDTLHNHVLNGFYYVGDAVPGNTVRVEPVSDLNFPTVITDAVEASDAARAFMGRNGGSYVLTELQKIAADINNDGVISSADALAILKISTGELTAGDFGSDKWVFVDSSYKLTATNWASAPKSITYSPLDSVKIKQTFWGMVRGDVIGDGYQSSIIITGKPTDGFSNSVTGALYSIPSDLSAKPGDTLYLPLKINPNGSSIGAFNASLSLNKNLLTYTGKFTEGTSIPGDKGWVMSAHFDSAGHLNIGETDFSGNIDPIITDGTLGVFEFIVNNDAEIGDTSSVLFEHLSASDARLVKIPVNKGNGKIIVTDGISSVDDNIIYEYALKQNYPNPFNPKTIINYSLANEGRVNIEVFNSIGERIAVLLDGVQQKGNHSVNWDASNYASGVYFYRIKAGEFTQVRKMMLLK